MHRHTTQTLSHPEAVRRVHERLLADEGLSGAVVRTSDGAGVHVVERGEGPPVVLIHGSGSPGLFWLPVLRRLDDVRALVVDRPGFGLSDPVPSPPDPLRSGAVDWCDRLLDALDLPSAILVGHSMGALWSLRYALARPERVAALAMIGTPSLPGTRAPLPFRVMATPGLGSLVSRQRETPASLGRFAGLIGEGDTIVQHRDLVELMVAVGNDPVASTATLDEVRALVSPSALLSRGAFRGAERTTADELRRLAVPTLLIWGEHDPLGDAEAARGVQRLVPDCTLHLVVGGHAPWLGRADEVAGCLLTWVDGVADRFR